MEKRKRHNAAFKAKVALEAVKAEKRVEALIRLAEEYDVDGAIHFSVPVCYHETGAARIISDALKGKGVPVLELEGDMTDERNYSPEQTAEKLSSFLEVLGKGEGN